MKESKKITIYVNNIEKIVSPFSSNVITEELHNYIKHQCLKISLTEPLTFVVIGNIDNEKQEKIKESIHNYYQSYIEQYEKIDKYDEWIRLLLLFLGIVFIIISQNFNFVISELFLVAGWVVIWELVYDILFEKKKRKREYLRYKQIFSSRIEFLKNKE